MKKALAVFAVSLCSACVPIPHRTYHTPVIHGRIVQSGKPVEGVMMRVIAEPKIDAPCTGERISETRTDANGEFQFCPKPELGLWVFLLPAHRIFHWNTCAEVGGQWKLLNESQRYTIVEYGPHEIERLDCDLDATCTRATDIDITPEKLRAALRDKRCAGIADPK